MDDGRYIVDSRLMIEDGWYAYFQARIFPKQVTVVGVICGLNFLLFLYSALFSLGNPVFPLLKNQHFANSNSILDCTVISNECLWTPGAPWVDKLHFFFLSGAKSHKRRDTIFGKFNFVTLCLGIWFRIETSRPTMSLRIATRFLSIDLFPKNRQLGRLI